MTDAADRARDRAAIAELVAGYARHADRREFDALAALFTDDGVLAMHDGDPDITEPTRVRHGRGEIVAALETLRRYEVTHHMLGQHSVWFGATGRATGETYCLASHVRRAPDGATMRMMAIRYFDDYFQDTEDSTWRIARRRLAIDWVDEHSMA